MTRTQYYESNLTPELRNKLATFNEELEALCVRLGVEFRHEDSHGAGYLVIGSKDIGDSVSACYIVEEDATPDTERAPAPMSTDAERLVKFGGIDTSIRGGPDAERREPYGAILVKPSGVLFHTIRRSSMPEVYDRQPVTPEDCPLQHDEVPCPICLGVKL